MEDKMFRIPLLLTQADYENLMYKAMNKEPLSDGDYELLKHFIDNAMYWKGRYKELTKHMRQFYDDEKIGIIID